MQQPHEIRALEEGGYTYCYACRQWEDDAFCYPDDHSRHCGHVLQALGLPANAASMVVVCRQTLERFAASATARPPGAIRLTVIAVQKEADPNGGAEGAAMTTGGSDA